MPSVRSKLKFAMSTHKVVHVVNTDKPIELDEDGNIGFYAYCGMPFYEREIADSVPEARYFRRCRPCYRGDVDDAA